MQTTEGEALLGTDTSFVLDEAMQSHAARHERRGYLGMSSLGKEDAREIWLNWRWSFPSDFPSRILRIFRLGHHIEREVVMLLKQIPGVTVDEVDPDTGAQFEFDDKGKHVGGHSDGKIKGIPAAPVAVHTLEVKSAKNSEFKLAKKLGIKAWRIEYYEQMQMYMERQKTQRGLFVVYNKDTSELYFERIEWQPGSYDRMMDRADELISLEEPPDSVYPSPNFYKLKNFKTPRWQRIYWNEELPPPHCRNCRHVSPMTDGDQRWHCFRHKQDMAIEYQRIGCGYHSYNPAFLAGSYDFEQEHAGVMRYKEKGTGMEFWNVETVKDHGYGAMVFDSQELYQLSQGGLLNNVSLADTGILKIRAATEGQIEKITPRNDD